MGGRDGTGDAVRWFGAEAFETRVIVMKKEPAIVKKRKKPLANNNKKKIILGSGSYRGLPSKILEFFQLVVNLLFGVELVVVILTKVMEGNTISQHVVDCDYHAVGYGNNSAVFSTPNCKPVKLCFIK